MAVALGTISGRLMRRPNNRVGDLIFYFVSLGLRPDNGQIALFPVKNGDFKVAREMSHVRTRLHIKDPIHSLWRFDHNFFHREK